MRRDADDRASAARRANPKANNFLVANQFIVQGEREIVGSTWSPSSTASARAARAQSPSDAQATLARAHTQLQTYRAKPPELIASIRCVISDGVSARIGLLTAGVDRFAPWRTIDGEKLEDDGGQNSKC